MRKWMATAVAAAVLTGGVAFAATGSQAPGAAPAGAQPKGAMGPGTELRALSRLTGKSVDEILASLGVTPDQLRAELQRENRAAAQHRHRTVAALAKLTGESVDEINALLQPGVSVDEVLAQLGVTPEQLRAAMAEAARVEAQQLQRTVRALAKLTGKSVDEIRAMLKPGVRMEEVLGQLGVTPEQLRASIAETARGEAQQLQRTVRAMAALTGKSPDEIRALLKPGVKLDDVLNQLGVTAEQMREAMKGRK